MNTVGEFHYRLRMPVGGYRPGSHPGSNIGTGQDFAAHARLFDTADPRRLDIRASLRNVRREWLVKVYQQRAAVAVHALVDVSASMQFGTPSKLHRVAGFAQSLGYSAHRSGDPAGMLAFDADERPDLYLPASHNRGIGTVMAGLLRNVKFKQGVGSAAGLLGAAKKLAGKKALVFMVSDFHWPLDELQTSLDVLTQATVVPIVVWDEAETNPPSADGLLALRDAESGERRSLWMRATTRVEWHARVDTRRQEIRTLFAARDIRPFFIAGEFEPESLSRYFMEEVA